MVRSGVGTLARLLGFFSPPPLDIPLGCGQELSPPLSESSVKLAALHYMASEFDAAPERNHRGELKGRVCVFSLPVYWYNMFVSPFPRLV